MDFDTSKENIQPLRGGRNVTQLGMALQAQHNQESQIELEQQKEEFETQIRTYTGEDPLDNYYHYILWIEQCYPKHGQQGNFSDLLYDCLTKFQDDVRYANDRRFCKLWIKYIDMQENPIEMYKILYSKDTCKGCADLYKAWAYYHEAVGDFRTADLVFQTGIKECAQPFDELNIAHQNMIYAAGQQLIRGVDNQRLLEERQALTTLQSFRTGRVGSVRSIAAATPGILPSNVSMQRTNAPIQVFEDYGEVGIGAVAAPVNILSAVKRDITKENFMKAGTWSSGTKRTAASHHKGPSFLIHDEASESPEVKGIMLPQDFFTHTLEDFSHWKSDITTPDPDDPTKIPMYCKRQVYIDSSTEYSIEEVRSRRYLRKNRSRLSVPFMETEQAIQSIVGGDSIVDTSMNEEPVMVPEYENPLLQSCNLSQHPTLPEHLNHQSDLLHQSLQQNQSHLHQQSHIQQQQYVQQQQQMQVSQQLFLQQQVEPQQHLLNISSPKLLPHLHEVQNISGIRSFNNVSLGAMEVPTPEMVQFQQHEQSSYNSPNKVLQNFSSQSSFRHPQQVQSPHRFQQQPYASPVMAAPPSQEILPADALMDVLWADTSSENIMPNELPKTHLSKFAVFEESTVFPKAQAQPKGSAMKTPFKILSDEDLAETGSRGGMDTATTAQANDGAKRLAVFDDHEENSSDRLDLNSTNTEIFCLRAMHVSTPQKLATIIEEKSSYASSSSGASSNTANKTRVNNMKTIEENSFHKTSFNNIKTITEEESRYHSNLAQNMKANAALRISLLGDLMDCDTQPSTPTLEAQVPVYEVDDDDEDEEEEEEEEDDEDDHEEYQAVEHVPYPILAKSPSDPFKAPVIAKLLHHVGFPGRHRQGYSILYNGVPRLAVKKEPCTIGGDKYYVEKLLGKGTFGSVFKCIRVIDGELVALKVQKPPNKWEFYICRELQSRLAKHELRNKFMNVHMGYFYDTASVLLSDFSPYGSLLDAANNLKIKLRKTGMKENLCIHFTLEMLNIVQAMHDVKIIHADIKPDNFLVTLHGNDVGLQLIDFGCSIDMSLYPEGTTFTRTITTSGFMSCEMRDNRPWSYHTDLFCVAATTHVLLFDKYIHIQKKDNIWSIVQKIQRYQSVDLWSTFFNILLNMQDGLPDINHLKQILNMCLKPQELKHEIREIINTLKNQ